MSLTILSKNAELARIAGLIFYGAATERDLASIDIGEVFAIKSDTSAPRYSWSMDAETATKAKGKAGTNTDRSRRFIASSERSDRMGDIIRVKGWDFSEFKANPQAFWCHETRGIPIGLVTEMSKEVRKDEPVLIESITYHEADINPFADVVMRMVDAGAIRTVSVGFQPVEVYIPKDVEERTKLGLGQYGVEFRKQKQIELSNCPIPANPDAVSVRSLMSKALCELVQSKHISPAAASGFMLSTEERSIFAVGGLPQESLEPVTPPAPAPLERALQSFELALGTFSKGADRLTAIEQRVAKLEQASVAPVVVETPERKQQSTKASAFYAKVFAAASDKLKQPAPGK